MENLLIIYCLQRNILKKTYRVTIDIDIDENMIKQFEKGIVLKDHICCPAIIEVQDTHTAFVTITEGKYHQIKRMFGCFGAKVLELHRITMGNLICLLIFPKVVVEKLQNKK